MKKGTHITKKYNRIKDQRYPPIAQLSNNCNPLPTFNINEFTFKKFILPTAIANGWIYQTPPGFIHLVAENGVINFPNRNYTVIEFTYNYRLRGSCLITYYDNTTQVIFYTAGGGQGTVKISKTHYHNTPLTSTSNIKTLSTDGGNFTALYADVYFSD